MAGKRFTVIIVNYNGNAMLLDCVLSALKEGVPPGQIIVVDNASQDDSVENLVNNAPGVTIIYNKCNAGFSTAVNQGLRQVKTEYALILNNDAALQPGALAAFVNTFEKQHNVGLAGGQLFYPDGRQQNSVAAIPNLATELIPKALLKIVQPVRFSGKLEGNEPIPVDSVIGACLAIRVVALDRIGLLDEDFFFYMEETEWCFRARRMGVAVYYVPEARATHAQGKTANSFRAQARIEFQRSKLLFFKKAYGLAEYWLCLFFLVIRSMVNTAANTLLCLITLCLIARQRKKTTSYWYISVWYALGMPREWGLPGKCKKPGDKPL